MYKQHQTINHYILHYFVEVYCVRNLKHLFKNWICDPFFFHIQMQLEFWSGATHSTERSAWKLPSGGYFPCGNAGALYFGSWGVLGGRGTHTWGPLSFIPPGGCWFSNAAVDDLRSLCYAVLHRVAKPDHNLQARNFVKVDSPVQPGDVTNGLLSTKSSQKIGCFIGYLAEDISKRIHFRAWYN